MKTTKMFALMAVLAMAFAGVVVAAEQNDADNEPAITFFAEGKLSTGATEYNKMMVFGYDDKSIIINTTYMTNLGTATEFIVTLADNETYAEATNKTTIGPVSAQNGKIVIDAATLTLGTNLYVSLYDYAKSDTLLSVATVASPGFTTAVKINLMPNHTPTLTAEDRTSDWARANGFSIANTSTTGTEADKAVPAVAVEDTSIVRNVKYSLEDTNAATHTKDEKGVYTLKGWAIMPSETSEIVFVPGQYSVEEIVMTLADKYHLDTATDTQGKYSPFPTVTTPAADNKGIDQVADTLILFAIYEKVTYSIILADGITATGTAAAGWGITDIPFPTTDSTVKASVTSKVDADSFATLRIQTLVPATYNYTINVFKLKGVNASGEKVYEADGSYVDGADTSANSDIKMVTNGLFKVSKVKSDLLLQIVPAKVSSPTAFQTNGYALQIQAIDNTNGLGHVKLSLDLYDYKPYSAKVSETLTVKDQIAITGTYFKDLGDGVRAYGNLDNLTAVLATGDNVNLYMDNSSTAANTTVVDNKAAATLLTDDTAVYDLDWKATQVDSKNIGIYAAKGIWTQYTAFGDTDTSSEVVTPWSLFTA